LKHVGAGREQLDSNNVLTRPKNMSVHFAEIMVAQRNTRDYERPKGEASSSTDTITGVRRISRPCPSLGISTHRFYCWKKHDGLMGADDIRQWMRLDQ